VVEGGRPDSNGLVDIYYFTWFEIPELEICLEDLDGHGEKWRRHESAYNISHRHVVIEQVPRPKTKLISWPKG
jgi:hypothetical protein